MRQDLGLGLSERAFATAEFQRNVEKVDAQSEASQAFGGFAELYVSGPRSPAPATRLARTSSGVCRSA